MNLCFLTGAALTTAALLALEWRRPDRRQLVFRMAATLVAATALGRLAWPPDEPGAVQRSTAAALWTATDQGPDADPGPAARFFLPDASGTAPPDAKPVPDVSTLRRRLPNLKILHLHGDGFDPAEISALAGLRVVFHPPERRATPAVDVIFLHCPRASLLGDPLTVAGRVGGLVPGQAILLSLEAPDGNTVETRTTVADANGQATFTLVGAALPAAGRFQWKLKIGQILRSIHVLVANPVLPRILILESSPRFDTTALRRWFEGATGTLVVRTQTGKEQFRYAASREPPAGFTTLDATVLSGYDLLLADARALTTLGAAERAALAAAVEKNGLGLLTRADEAIFPPDAPPIAPELRPLLPWKLAALHDFPPNEERAVHPHWPGQTSAPTLPVPAAPFGIDPAPAQETVVDDGQGSALVAAVRRGRGWVALSLLGDTTRWQRGADSAAFAGYWSWLFSKISRASETGRWSLEDGDAGPVFVDHPLELCWTGSSSARPTGAVVTAGSNAPATPLPLAQDLEDPGIWRGTFWPRSTGWHRLVDGAGATLDFYVDAAGDWPALQAARRRDATARIASDSAGSNSPVAHTPDPSHVHPGWWFGCFLLAAGYLWTERRFAGGQPGS